VDGVVNAPEGRPEKHAFYVMVAAEVFARYPHRNQKKERDAEWRERTGLSPDQLYRYWKEVKVSGAA
jgi:hypothetical protein